MLDEHCSGIFPKGKCVVWCEGGCKELGVCVSLHESHWTGRCCSSQGPGLWQKLASCKPSALAGLVLVALLEEGVDEGNVAGDFSAVLAEGVKLLFCYPFGCVISHFCSELCWCDSLLQPELCAGLHMCMEHLSFCQRFAKCVNECKDVSLPVKFAYFCCCVWQTCRAYSKQHGVFNELWEGTEKLKRNPKVMLRWEIR